MDGDRADMGRGPILIIAGVIVVVALVAGDGRGLLRSVVHGFGWGLGREISHTLLHGR